MCRAIGYSGHLPWPSISKDHFIDASALWGSSYTGAQLLYPFRKYVNIEEWPYGSSSPSRRVLAGLLPMGLGFVVFIG